MKKALLIMLAVLFSAAVAHAALKSDLSPRLPRKIKLDKKETLVLDKNTHIVLAPKSTPTARFAAGELSRFLSRALGCSIPVVSAPKAQGVAISVGDNQYAKALGINPASFDRDGFAARMLEADSVITHAGTGAIIGAVKAGKKVIAVPRLSRYGEHVDDHQTQIIDQFNEMDLILGLSGVEQLEAALAELPTRQFKSYTSNTHRIIADIEAFLGG